MIISKLRPASGLIAKSFGELVAKRNMSGGHDRTFPLRPSTWQWTKFKDLAHFYIMIGAIPAGLVVLYSNVFIGPATLSEIPKDYEPKYWEYYKHPITRFIARYMMHNPQQEYEKYLSHIFMEDEKRRLRAIEKKIKDMMAVRNDYQAYYYRPVMAKYHRRDREASDYLDSIRGD